MAMSEDDYDEEEDEEDEVGLPEELREVDDVEMNGMDVDGNDEEMEAGSLGEPDGDDQDQDDVDGDEEEDGEADDEDAEVDADEDDDDEGDAEEDDDDDDDDNDDDDGDGDEDDEAEGDGAADDDVDMADQETKSEGDVKLREVSAQPLPDPPHLVRRALFHPQWDVPPKSFSIEAIVGIPLPSPVHALASTSCLTHLLTGPQDGYVRVYDFWASVNGGQVMMPQQRAVVGLGEGVNKAGVGRGWWAVEGPERDGVKANEAVYSLACEQDGLFSLAGTQSGAINLYTLRHSPGHLVHSLKGHSQVVSCLTMLPGDKSFLSGSWDGTVREWDLNTGQAIRTHPTHGAQISTVALRPFGHPISPAPSPREQAQEDDGRLSVSVAVGPDFFVDSRENGRNDVPHGRENGEPSAADVSKHPEPSAEASKAPSPTDEAGPPKGELKPATDAPKASSRESTPDSLFDDEDAEGSIVPPSGMQTTTAGSPAPPNLALPVAGPSSSSSKQVNGLHSASASSSAQQRQQSQAQSIARAKAAMAIPLLSPTSYRSFSEDVMLTSSIDGQVTLIDRRLPQREGAAGRLVPSDKAPPWCMSACWLADGNQVLAGRRNGTIDVWDVRRSLSSSSAGSAAPRLLRTLRTPIESGPISCLAALPDGKHVATASTDNIRLWNMTDVFETDDSAKRRSSRPPFKIIAGHHGGIVSSMLVDPTSRFLISASGDRGWQAGESTKVVLVHEIKW